MTVACISRLARSPTVKAPPIPPSHAPVRSQSRRTSSMKALFCCGCVKPKADKAKSKQEFADVAQPKQTKGAGQRHGESLSRTEPYVLKKVAWSTAGLHAGSAPHGHA